MNFCSPALDVMIHCDKPCVDGYEASNLSLGKGFKTEYFVRPPVDIRIDFPEDIEISHIIFNTRISSFKSICLNLFTSEKQLHHPGSENDKSRSDEATSSDDQNGSTQKDSGGKNFPHTSDTVCISDSTFYCVARVNCKYQDSVALKNPFYRHSSSLPQPPAVKEDPEMYVGTLRHSNRSALSSVGCLLIRILRTESSGPIPLRSLEVWGVPALGLPIRRKQVLISKWRQGFKQHSSNHQPFNLYNSIPQVQDPSLLDASTDNDISDEIDIPEDFLDPITWEVMQIPLLLPSGHSIDSSTLEKFKITEATWGRCPSDPFTGIPFSASSQPTPNVPLKARIDRFLTLHGSASQLKGIGRTVGSLTDTYGSRQKFQEGVCNASHKNVSKKAYVGSRTPEDSSFSSSDNGKQQLQSSSSSISTKRPHSSDEEETIEDEINSLLKGKTRYLPQHSSLGNIKKMEEKDMTDISRKKSNDYESCKNTPRYSGQPSSLTLQGSISEKPKTCSANPSGGHSVLRMLGAAASVRRPAVQRKHPAVCSRKPLSTLGDHKQERINGPSAAEGGLRASEPNHRNQTCPCGDDHILYELSCCHMLCRKCLLSTPSSSEVLCQTCSKSYPKTSIRRYHKPSLFF